MATGTAFAYKFESDVGTWTASDQVTEYPASNVGNPYPGRVWRSNSGTLKWIKVDTLSAIGATYAFIAGANFHQGTMLPTYPHIYATNDANLFNNFADEAAWSVGTNLGEMDDSGGRYAKKRFASVQSFRYWIIWFSYNVLNPPPYVELGRVVFTSHLQMPYPHDEPWSDSLKSVATVSEAGFSRQFPVGIKRPPLRKTTMEFQKQLLSDSDRKNIIAMVESVDELTPIFCDMYPDDLTADNVIYARMNEGVDIGRYMLSQAKLSIPLLEVR